MTEFQAAIVLAQMTRLEEQMRKREANARLLDEQLAELKEIRLLRRDERITRHAYHLYLFKLAPEFADRVDKKDFVRKVNAEGIPLSEGYVPLNRNKSILDMIEMWTGERRVYDCPVCERACAKEAMWLTQNVLLSDEQAIYDVAEALRKVIRSYD